VTSSNLVELYDSMQVTPQTGVPYHTIRRGSVLTMGTKVANYAATDFNGTVQAVLINVATGTIYPVQQYTTQSITAGTYANYTFTSSPVTAPGGNYILAVQHQPGGSGSYIYTGSLFYENPILINIIGAVEVSTVNTSADKVTIYPNPAKDQVSVDLNGLEVNKIIITDVEGHQLRELTPAANQSVINVPVADFASGIYFVSLQTGGDIITRKIVIAK
jgi:type IX secretion system substrate protein